VNHYLAVLPPSLWLVKHAFFLEKKKNVMKFLCPTKKRTPPTRVHTTFQPSLWVLHFFFTHKKNLTIMSWAAQNMSIQPRIWVLHFFLVKIKQNIYTLDLRRPFSVWAILAIRPSWWSCSQDWTVCGLCVCVSGYIHKYIHASYIEHTHIL